MMTNLEDQEDINAAFEKLLFAEEIAEEKAHAEGYEVGKNEIIEGYHLGYHRGSEIAARLGYYYGVIEYHLKKQLFKGKVIQQAIKLQDIIINFPQNNDMSIDILQAVDDIKCKFVRLCSLAKIDSSYPEADQMNF